MCSTFVDSFSPVIHQRDEDDLRTRKMLRRGAGREKRTRVRREEMILGMMRRKRIPGTTHIGIMSSDMNLTSTIR